jgi:uncharacterized protein YjbJ (UPF0337 family)
MNWDQIEGKWKQFSGKAREKWGKLTDSDMEVIKGNRDQLVGKIQERYGVMKDDAERQVSDFSNSLGADSIQDNRQADSQGKSRGAGSQ